MSLADLVGLTVEQAKARCPELTDEQVQFTVAPQADTFGCTARVIAVRGDKLLAGWFRDTVQPKETA